MLILGISSYYHDSSITLIKNNEIIFAAQEERYSRKKNDENFPRQAILSCLDFTNIKLSEVDAFVFYENPYIKFERIINTYISNSPKGYNFFKRSFPIWVREKINLKKLIEKELLSIDSQLKEIKNKIFFSKHHFSHAASAYYPSPFKDANVLVLDGVGESATSSISHGKDKELKILKEIEYPNSLGLLYSTFTSFLGFKVNSGEYKLMGLAPYGEGKYVNLILDNIIDLKKDGSFELNLNYFDFSDENFMFNEKLISLFGIKNKLENEKFNEKYLDIAKSIQLVTELTIINMCHHIKSLGLSKNLCLAGGVALNCVANGKIHKENIFDNIWIQPASGDAGGSLGAALSFIYSNNFKEKDSIKKNQNDIMKNSLLGPNFKNNEIKNYLLKNKIIFEEFNDEDKLFNLASDLLSKKKIIGWFQDRMEFGPRALGSRSILADPRDQNMQRDLNLKIKFRESFRPFAPIILENEARNIFENVKKSPYMLITDEIKEKKNIDLVNKAEGFKKMNIIKSNFPAVTHVDYSSRIQTINSSNGKIYNLLKKFEIKTGCPMLINTSFNVRGEPIVCKPADAINCFFGTGIDILIINNFIIKKEKNKSHIKKDFKYDYLID